MIGINDVIDKHKRLSKTIDFIKIGDMAVINLNNMFPVPDGIYSLKNPKTEKNSQYRTLLNNEIRIIRKKQDYIINNAKSVYNHKITNGGKSNQNQVSVEMILNYLKSNVRNILN